MPSPPDRIGAQTIGYLVCPWQARRGSVHSAYNGAVNLRLGSQLCTLAPERLPDGPATIRVADAGWPRLGGVAAGDPVAVRAAWLRVGAIVVDLRTARVWRPADPPATIAAEALVRSAALRGQAVERGGAPWIPGRVRHVITDRDCAHAGAELIGRGVGLTPSGDDALVGALAAAWVAGRADRAAAEVHARLAAAVRGCLDRTNDLSASFLQMAAVGQFQEPVWQAAVALVGGAVAGGQRRLLSLGATSGADCALGLATALETIIDRSGRVAA